MGLKLTPEQIEEIRSRIRAGRIHMPVEPSRELSREKTWSGPHHHHYESQSHNRGTVVHHDHVLHNYKGPGFHDHELSRYAPCLDSQCPHTEIDRVWKEKVAETPEHGQWSPDGLLISLPEEENYLASRMHSEMLAKLRGNRGKLHWKSQTTEGLLSQLIDEVDELVKEVEKVRGPEPSPGDIGKAIFFWDVWKEAADVANFAAMIADRLQPEDLDNG